LKLYRALSREALLFTFAVGDSDVSYELSLYRDGKPIRRREVVSLNYSDRVVQLDFGAPLPLESTWLHQSDGAEIGFKLAESLGVDLDQSKRPLRSFAVPPPEWCRRSRERKQGDSAP
jgi:hypothetical protein